jgi:hypothetical protein
VLLALAMLVACLNLDAFALGEIRFEWMIPVCGFVSQDLSAIPSAGFEGYRPIPTPPPYSTFVIRYAP